MAPQNGFMTLFNNLTGKILRSRFHGLMSASTLLISVTGRKSGNKITTPVNYVLSDRQVLITSDLGKNWWMNLHKNKSVVILLKKEEIPCRAELIEKEEQIIPYLEEYCAGLPSAAKYMKVSRNADESFDQESLLEAAKGRVMVVCNLPN